MRSAFDLLVTIPLHGGAELHRPLSRARRRSGVRHRRSAHAAGEGRAEHLRDRRRHQPADLEGGLGHALRGGRPDREHPPPPRRPAADGEFDGHANCFIETGFRKALLIDFNYDTEPLPGRFPAPALGPLPLLKESHLNHIGKLMFQWFYWHLLLPGRDIPGIPSQMSMAGKHPVEPTTPPPEA